MEGASAVASRDGLIRFFGVPQRLVPHHGDEGAHHGVGGVNAVKARLDYFHGGNLPAFDQLRLLDQRQAAKLGCAHVEDLAAAAA